MRSFSRNRRSWLTPGSGTGRPAEFPVESTTVSVVASCKACTAGRSSSPPHAHRPTIDAMFVGNLITVVWSAGVPVQVGGTRRKSPLFVPVARCPT